LLLSIAVGRMREAYYTVPNWEGNMDLKLGNSGD
jgi:hypothetical protein